MAFADTQKLVVELDLKGNFSRQIADARKSVAKLDVDVGRLQDNARRGLGNLSRNVALIGVAATAGIAAAVKAGLGDLATLENAITSIDGAIAQLGLTGQLTGKQVADWANEIERDIDAAFDDKAIAQSATTLLRYGKVAPKALRPALEVVADLAAKTGDVESASEILAKSLAAPERAAARLMRIGIILTEQQQEQIEAMVEAGDAAGAQAALLDAVAQSTKGAAKAMAGPYQDAINKTNDATEDGRKALAIGFLPVITKVADKLSDLVADPKALAQIKEFGEGLAGGLDDLIGIAEKLPWGAIGTSLRIGGLGAKAILDAFTALPPWVQTAVITGWGLNKLTGGALGAIVGELGKGLIKGVLGINAGVVHIKAGAVAGVGAAGAAGGAATAGRGAGVAAAIGKVFIAGMAAAVIAELVNVRGQQSAANQAQAAGVAQQATVYVAGANIEDLKRNLAGLKERQAYLTANLTPEAIAYQLDIDGVKTTTERVITTLQNQITTLEGAAAARQNVTNERLDSLKAATAAAAAQAITSSASERAAVERVRSAQAQAVAAIQGTRSETAAVRRAINAKDFSPTIRVGVSIRNVVSAQNQLKTIYRTQS